MNFTEFRERQITLFKKMWTEKEISRAGETFIDKENQLEDFCDNIDLGKFTFYLQYLLLLT